MANDQVKIKKESGYENSVCCSDGAHYPYGTSLNLRDEMIEELGLENVAVGDVVEVRGFAFVEGKSERSDINESSKSVDLQLTSVKLSRATVDRAEALYGPKS